MGVRGSIDTLEVNISWADVQLETTHSNSTLYFAIFRSIWGQYYKEKHKTRLKTNVKRTVLNNTKLRHFWAQIVSWAPIHARKTFIILAPGHSRYAKSAYVYRQIMIRLPEHHPDAHREFMEIYHVVWRTQRQVLGRIVPRPNHRASTYEKYKDTWRTDKRKGDDREAAFGVDRVHACVHASMRPCKSLSVSLSQWERSVRSEWLTV